MSSHSKRNSVYWNNADCEINNLFAHTLPVYSDKQLSLYRNDTGDKGGNKRYIIENNKKAMMNTLQGAAFSAIDGMTGRRVVIKRASKNLVYRQLSTKGISISEDIRTEAKLLKEICTKDENCDAGIAKYVDFFDDKDDFYLVTEHGGGELLAHVQEYHPFYRNTKIMTINKGSNSNNSNNSNSSVGTTGNTTHHPTGTSKVAINITNDDNNAELIKQWKKEIRYYFRILVRSVYYLHIECNVAHLDLSLENAVIDKNQNSHDKTDNDPFVRLIDFGLARENPNKYSKPNGTNKWNYGGWAGKPVYMTPEIIKIREYKQKMYGKGKVIYSVNDIPKYLMYDPRSADIWALGVMLFIMLVGSEPWLLAESTDKRYDMINNGKMKELLKEWNAEEYMDPQAFDLLNRIFVCERKRLNIKGVLDHGYVKNAPRTLKKIDEKETNGNSAHARLKSSSSRKSLLRKSHSRGHIKQRSSMINVI